MCEDAYVAEIRVGLLVNGKVIGGIEEGIQFVVGEVIIRVATMGESRIRVSASKFATEEEARAFVPRMISGLYNMTLQHGIVFNNSIKELTVTRFDDPKAAAKGLNKNFKTSYHDIHGAVSNEGFFIRKEHEVISAIWGGSANVVVGVGAEFIKQSIFDGISGAFRVDQMPSEDVQTALDLYLVHIGESTLRAKLLTLVTCLEVLAERHERPKEVKACIMSFAETLRAESAQCDNNELKSGYERAAEFLTSNAGREAIKERVRRFTWSLVSEHEDNPTAFVKKVADAYNVRSSISHGSKPNDEKTLEAFEVVRGVVKMALLRELGVVDAKN